MLCACVVRLVPCISLPRTQINWFYDQEGGMYLETFLQKYLYHEFLGHNLG